MNDCKRLGHCFGKELSNSGIRGRRCKQCGDVNIELDEAVAKVNLGKFYSDLVESPSIEGLPK